MEERVEERRVQIEERRVQMEERRLRMEERQGDFMNQLTTIFASRKRSNPPQTDQDVPGKRHQMQLRNDTDLLSGERHTNSDFQSDTDTDFQSDNDTDFQSESETDSHSETHLESETAFQSAAPACMDPHTPEDPMWFLFPNGDHLFQVPAASYDQVESTGYAWFHIWQKGSRKSGIFFIKRKCAGVLKCANSCGYVQRPYVAPKKPPAGKRSYHDKDYRQFCRGTCAEAGHLDVPLVEVPCHCQLFYRCRGGSSVLEVEHRGTHEHPRPPVCRATGAELRVYQEEALKNIRVLPKKKPSQAMQVGLQIRMWTLSVNVSGGLESRRHATWNRS